MTDKTLHSASDKDVPHSIPPEATLSRRRSRGSGRAAGSAEGGEGLPPRRVRHPSERERMAKWFIHTLFVLLLALMAGLMYWGYYKFSDV